MSFQNMEEFIDYAKRKLPRNDGVAQERFETYKSLDPLPDIAPALLNSSDVFKYVAHTGMIYPFDPKKLKSASYAVSLLGKCYFWDDDGNANTEDINEGQKFSLQPNSIVFVTLEPYFRIPDYIALRFNLKISHVYKGLLLGTGPLVDPGFCGKLSIPLHNLTTNTYHFYGGQELIWMEFTKISGNDRWTEQRKSESIRKVDDIRGFYREFPMDDNRAKMQVFEYVDKALKDVYDAPINREHSVRSSIPDAIKNAQETAENAKEFAENANNEVKKVKEIYTKWSVIGILGTVLALTAIIATIFVPVNSLVTDTTKYISETEPELRGLISEQNRIIEEQNKRLDIQSKQIEECNQQINDLNEKLTEQ